MSAILKALQKRVSLAKGAGNTKIVFTTNTIHNVTEYFEATEKIVTELKGQVKTAELIIETQKRTIKLLEDKLG